MNPGIDLSGTVEASSYSGIRIGDKVVANGWGLSQTHHGGYAQKARLSGDWLVETRSRKEKFHVGNYIDSRAGARVDRCDTDLATQSFVGLYAQRFVRRCLGRCACVAASGPDISAKFLLGTIPGRFI